MKMFLSRELDFGRRRRADSGHEAMQFDVV